MKKASDFINGKVVFNNLNGLGTLEIMSSRGYKLLAKLHSVSTKEGNWIAQAINEKKEREDDEKMFMPSFWFMTDSHNFIKPKGNNLQEIVDDLHKIAKENKHGMICPVTILNKKGKELKRVGASCHVNREGCVDTSEWLSEIMEVECIRLYDGITSNNINQNK